MREISVKFDGSNQQYTYITDDNTIKVGDECVVLTPTGVKIVKVYQVDTATGKATKPIVCKVDLEAYHKKVSMLAEKNRLKALIEKRVKELTEGVIVERLAESDSTLRNLLNQMKSI